MAASSPLDQHTAPVASTSTKSGKATAAMVVGIVGLVLTLLVGVFAIPVCIVGMVLGFMGRADAKRGATNGGMATAGLVCSIIGIALAIVFAAIIGAVLAGNN